MGEAKRRGSASQRQSEAQAAQRALFPASVTCNNCQAELTEIHPMDVRGMPGMRLAGGAHCEACEHDTWVLDGTPEGVALAQQFLNEGHDGATVKTGFAKR